MVPTETHILGHLDEGEGILCGLGRQHPRAEGRWQGTQTGGWQDLSLQRTQQETESHAQSHVTLLRAHSQALDLGIYIIIGPLIMGLVPAHLGTSFRMIKVTPAIIVDSVSFQSCSSGPEDP